MSVSLLLALLLGQALPSTDMPEPPPADLPTASGPRATSQAFGTARYDAVGYASWYGEEMAGNKTASGVRFEPSAITAAHKTLPFGSFAEVTSLDTGRTIVVLINDRGPHVPGRIIDLSRGAAELLGVTRQSVSPVRVRLAEPPAADQLALRNGRAASPRLDATPQLVAALRKQLPAKQAPAPRPAVAAPAVAAPAPPKPAAPKPAQPQPNLPKPTLPKPTAPVAVNGLFVQVAAFSSKPRAKALADRLGGSVMTSGALFRVRLGPFKNRAAALSARDDAARRGFGDARIVEE